MHSESDSVRVLDNTGYRIIEQIVWSTFKVTVEVECAVREN